MVTKMKARIDYICEATASISTLLQPNEILQVICMILTCISVFVSLCYTLYKWKTDAEKDGKIDDKELDNLFKIVNSHVEDIDNVINKKDGK